MPKALPTPTDTIKLTLLSLFCFFSFRVSAQCENQSTLSEPACGASTSMSNVGAKMSIPLTSTVNDYYCLSLTAGSNSCGAYSLSMNQFQATATTTDVNIYAAGACCYGSGATSSVLTYTKISPTNTTSSADICTGGTKVLSASVNCGTFTPSWTIASGGGSLSGTTYSAGAYTGSVTVRASLGSCYSDVSFNVTANRTVSAASATPSVCANMAMSSITHATTGVTGIATSTGLPPGVTAAYASNTITISGTPTTTGTFSYTITPTGCGSAIATGTITVTPSPVITNVATTDVLCNGGSTGTITITATSGTGAYEYSIDNGVTYQSNAVFSGLAIGSYTIVVEDAQGCSSSYASNPVTISQPAFALSVSETHTDASCSSVYNGTITASATGGTAPYQYSLNGGPLQSNPTFNGVSDGTYTVGVTDNAGCTASTTVTVSTIYTVSGTLDSVRNVSCFGGTDGRAYVHMSGGVQPYQYSIDGLIFQSSGTFTGLAAGNYTISMRDASGCTYYQAVTISQPNVITVILDSTVNGLCAGSSSAGIYISVSGGTSPYIYNWSTGATTQDLTAVSAGTYNVTVTDVNGCSGTTGATVSQPLPLYVTMESYHNVYCNGDSSGDIDITVNGGTPPYHFLWSNGATTEDIYHLPASATAYSVTVTDTNGCQQTLAQIITEPAPFVASVALSGTVCTATGATVTLSGGVSPYTVLWSNGATTTSVTNLAPGGYTVSATDANGCVKVEAINIVAPISLSMTVTNAACSGGANGAINLTVSGGTSPYTYLWNDGIATQNRTALSQGTYTVTVTDNNTCTTTASAAVNSPVPMSLTLSKTDVACQGGNTGSVTATVTGGTTPYTYVWTAGNAPYSQSQTNIGGGHYCVQVTDSNGCTVNGCIDVAGQPNPIYVTQSSKNPTCFESTDGFASVDVAGGQPPYAFAWSTTPSQTGNIATDLSSGAYTVTISDATGCSFTQTFNLTSAPQITVTASTANFITCANEADGIIVVDVTGGTAPFLYSLNMQTQTSDTFQNISAGNYAVSVRDANGCVGTTTATIIAATGALSVDLTADRTVVLSGQDVHLTAIAVSDSPIVQYQWQADSATFDYSGCADTTDCSNPIVRPATSTYVIVTAINSQGCATSDTLYIQVNPGGPDSYFFPTAFTPNGDGLNDHFEFNVLGCTTADVKIWNRWGQQVYSNPNQPNGFDGTSGWDGTYGGKKAQFDTYTYQIVLTFFDSHTETVAGTITVME